MNTTTLSEIGGNKIMTEVLEMDLPLTKHIIERVIKQIEKEFHHVKGLILTESDLKCLIYANLMMIRNFSRPTKTREEVIRAHSLHTELTWYDETGNLAITPDITIIEPHHLSIIRENDYMPLPSKQYSFGGKAIIFELKYCRNANGITENFFKREILKDFKKIQKLYRKLEVQGVSNDIFCYFVIFNKTDIVCDMFNDFLDKHGENQRYKFIYASGYVDMDVIDKNRIDHIRPKVILNRYNRVLPRELIGRDKIDEYLDQPFLKSFNAISSKNRYN